MNKLPPEQRDRLTPKERVVYEWLVNTHLSIKEIADKLGRAYNTVRTQVDRIFTKLGVHSRAELMLKGKLLVPPVPNTPSTPARPIV